MKKKNFVLFNLLLVSITSCSLSLNKDLFIPFDYNVDVIKTKFDTRRGAFVQRQNYQTLSYLTSEGVSGEIKEYRDVLTHSRYDSLHLNIPSTGKRKLLVIPVNFLDSDKSNNEQTRIDIQNAFFGARDNNQYYSVSEYYMRSSYGTLSLEGEVSEWYNLNSTSKELESGVYTRTSQNIVLEALKWINSDSYPGEKIHFRDYDTDKDGYIDGVFILYNYPYIKSNDHPLFWAYTDYMNGAISDEYKLSTYSWASTYFLDKKKGNVNSDTYIHETGHLFGLLDYYNTDENSFYQPTGSMDMMDYNLGDHTSFSKMLLNWTTPLVYKKEYLDINTSIVLRPFLTTGDVILLPTSKYNGTPYDEYLLLEYFVPQGLNKTPNYKYKYMDKYGNSGSFSYLSEYGLKIYHVDARLAYYNAKHNFICLLDDPNAETLLAESGLDKYYIDFAYTNTTRSGNDFVLYHLLESTGNNTFKDGIPGNNDLLFEEGVRFNDNVFSDFTFHNGEKLNARFYIESIDEVGIMLRFY